MTVRILTGDCRETLRHLPDKSVHCCVTSPPYWGLREYGGDDGMIGLEPTFADHLGSLTAVFDQVWRVLRDDGTLWLNYGDTYAGSGRGGKREINGVKTNRGCVTGNVNRNPLRLKSKNLLMMPSRIALNMQDLGWLLRSEIVWAKTNCMPESVTDRPVNAHEKIYLFAKQAKYYYDHLAVQTERTPASIARDYRPRGSNKTWDSNAPASRKALDRPERQKKQDGHGPRHAGFNDRYVDSDHIKANLRNVWSLSTETFKGGHFAVMPTAIAQNCIKAGTPENGIVLDPFGGAGTVGLVADRLGRDAILCEINAEYAEMSRKRIADDNPLFGSVTVE